MEAYDWNSRLSQQGSRHVVLASFIVQMVWNQHYCSKVMFQRLIHVSSSHIACMSLSQSRRDADTTSPTHSVIISSGSEASQVMNISSLPTVRKLH